MDALLRSTIGVDSVLILDGTILPNKRGSVNDFWSVPKQLGTNLGSPDLVGNCGEGCIGYGEYSTEKHLVISTVKRLINILDNAYIINREQYGPYNCRKTFPVARFQSPWSGIQLDIYSDQEAFQVYSCNVQNGTLPLRKTQGFFNSASRPRVTPKYGCVVLEVKDWIVGINHPK
jgi:aldose 1-epimerase